MGSTKKINLMGWVILNPSRGTISMMVNFLGGRGTAKELKSLNRQPNMKAISKITKDTAKASYRNLKVELLFQ